MNDQPLAGVQQAGIRPPTSTLPARASSSVQPALQPQPSSLHGQWHCLVCGKSIANRSVPSHLSGNPHKKKQAAWEASAHTRQQKDDDLAVQQLGVEDGKQVASQVVGPSSVPERAQTKVDAVVRGTAVRPGMWECEVCERVMMNITKNSHLKGSPHVKAKQKWTEKMLKEAQEEKLRSAREVEIERVERRKTELKEIQRTKQIRIDKEKRDALHLVEQTRAKEEKQRLQEVQLRLVEQIRIAEEKQKEMEEVRRIEQLRIDDEERKRVREVRLFEEEKQRKEADRQRAEQTKIEEAKQKQERDILLRTGAIKTDQSETESLEQLRRKQDTVIGQLTNKRRNRGPGENLAINKERQKEEQKGIEGEKVDQVGAEEDNLREEEEAEEIIRIEQEVEEWLNQGGGSGAKGQRIAEQRRIGGERRQGKEKDRMLPTEQQSVVTNDPLVSVSPSNSIPSTGSLRHTVPGVQNNHEGAAEVPIYQPIQIIQYIHWLAMMQETYRQQVQQQQQQQPITETYPVPITSAADLPPILYRVYDQTSVSKFTWEGFKAAAQFMPRDALGFKHMVQLHGNWSSREGTPFVSVTSSSDVAAWHVTHKQANGDQTDIMVALIDTAVLLGPCQIGVWEMHHARDHFGLPLWKCDRRAFDHEYICALRIPATAVIACCRPEYFVEMSKMFMKGLGRSD